MKRMLLALTLVVAGAAHAGTVGFNDDYAVGNWDTAFSSPCTGCSTTHGSDFMTLRGADGTDAPDQTVTRSITAPAYTTITFDWTYETEDILGDPFYDPFGYVLDGLFTQLTDDLGGFMQSGSGSVIVDAGSVFGFRVWSIDGLDGRSSATVTNFHAVPEPGTLALLGAALIGVVGSRRRRLGA